MKQEGLLRFEHITKEFPGVKALDDITFEVQKGDVHVLFGENGAGKSTLMKILTGVYQADQGKIFFDGQEIRPANILDSRKLGIGTVFQENSLVPHLNVAENIFLSREIRGKSKIINWKRTYQECEKWTRELGIEIDPRARVSSLSVAQQQIVEIVKIFSQQPRMVILDEPTSALSDNEIDNLFEIIRKMQKKGITFIFISHRMEEIKKIGDRGTVFRDGKLIGNIEDISGVSIDEIVRMMVGRDLAEQFPPRKAVIGDTRLEVKGLTIPKMIFDVSFQVKAGEVIGLAGLVGAGRTTTAKVIAGAIHRQKGTIYLNGKEIKINSPVDAIRHGIGYLPENRKEEGLILNKTVKENLTLPSIKNFRRLCFINGKKERGKVEEYKEKLNIRTPNINRIIKFLSGGNQQKVVFAKWLCANSEVYIFDEPTRGIDVGAKNEMYKIINNLAEQGAAIIVISSELPEIIGICDRIVVMHEGRVTGCISREEATQERIMHFALGGTYSEES